MTVDTAAIRARLEAADKGPWKYVMHHRPGRGRTVHELRSVHDIGPANPLARGYWGISVANARLVENAPTDIAVLLSEVDRLARERDALRAALEWYADADNYKSEYDHAEQIVYRSNGDADGGKRARKALEATDGQ